MRSGEGAEHARVLRRSVVNLHDVVQGRLEEGELAEDHWKKEHVEREWKQEVDSSISQTR